MKRLSELIRYDKEFYATVECAKGELSKAEPLPLFVNGLSGGADLSFLIEYIIELKSACKSPAVIFLPSENDMAKITSALSESGITSLEYKPRDLVFHNISASHDMERERLSVLSKIIRGECDAVVTTAPAALSYTIPVQMLISLEIGLSVGDEIEPKELVERLITLGFIRVDAVEAAGQFSHRGGIIDLWHSSETSPVRVEFFGNEIDRMVFFDPITQRSSLECESISLIPQSEVLISSGARERIADSIRRLIKKATAEEIKSKLGTELNVVTSSLPIDFRDKYLGIIYEKKECLLDYLPYSSVPSVVINTLAVRDSIKKASERLISEKESMEKSGLVTREAAVYSADIGFFEKFLSENVTVHIDAFGQSVTSSLQSGIFGFRTRRTVSYGDNPSMLLEDLKSYRKSLYKTLILCESKKSCEILRETLSENGIGAISLYDQSGIDLSEIPQGSVILTVGDGEGYELITPRIAVLSMARDEGRAIMKQRRRQRILRKAGGAGERLLSYADLSVGDYVVHANYGIGLFEGMQTVTVDGITRDYITIKYQGTDKLLVPCDRLEYIGKYIGERDKDGTVKLSKMGGADWNRAKSRAKAGAKDIAKDLIRLYAERQRLPGFSFPADSELEDEFAASFEYEETESQLLAISEIKSDMMKPVPMNRLLCGDVGFGKTEVALRAAFKAIMGGKQVAILVPTTILAMQHYQTALQRMRNYPVTVEMISRFRTPKQQEQILRKTKRGEVDILIGTHKLLSKQIEFRDLGLLIIDEEQRFGVSQKEKLREIAKNVDTLMLSATPIPRTLNMAMNGISDMSILDEAPGDRRPVQTYVLEHDEDVIIEAIRRELMRGGQTLYLYNRVENIEFVAAKINSAIPEARIATAHGQMERDELEDIWHMLVKGEIDVLVCTTIIETGVDLPNANTLIIENADRMGLSQLHQIRGRVGRSARQAYAYFTYRAGKVISEVAAKRLSAIREFAEFGAGFRVALRDLEIRGAGNLLGAQQHGYIESVGYDLYVKLLNEAVLTESGRMPEKPFESTVDVKINAHIPEKYISLSQNRMEMYKKISLITEKSDMEDVYDELLDRFGEPVREVMNLLKISLVRALASKAKIVRVEIKAQVIIFKQEKLDIEGWSALFAKRKGLSVRAYGMPSVIYKIPLGKTCLEEAIAVLEDYLYLTLEKEKGEETENEEKQ